MTRHLRCERVPPACTADGSWGGLEDFAEPAVAGHLAFWNLHEEGIDTLQVISSSDPSVGGRHVLLGTLLLPFLLSKDLSTCVFWVISEPPSDYRRPRRAFSIAVPPTYEMPLSRC